MIKNIAETERESLGEFLRKTREEQGISLEEVAEATKLSLSSLSALEADDYANLPAEAFVRGFYGIYAGHLSLDPIMVRERYVQQLKNMPRRSTKRIPTPTQLAVETSSMAERPSVNSNSIIGLTLMAVFIIVAAVSWYLSWNPATYLSHKLRGVPEETAVSAEQQEEGPNETTTPPKAGPIATAPVTTPVVPVDDKAGADQPAADQLAQEKSLIVPPIMPIPPKEPQKTPASIAAPPLQSAEANQVQAQEKPLPPPSTNTYLLKAIAKQPVQVTVKVDETPTERFTLSAGEQRVWNAGKSIVITLPAGTGTTFTLNDIPLNLPKKALGEEISISIPEYLLE